MLARGVQISHTRKVWIWLCNCHMVVRIRRILRVFVCILYNLVLICYDFSEAALTIIQVVCGWRNVLTDGRIQFSVVGEDLQRYARWAGWC